MGRLGCLLVGCCHGRPAAWGVVYGPAHTRVGLAPYYVGLRLLPLPLLEAAWVAGGVVGGTALVLAATPPGTTLSTLVLVYGVGRFGFELLRGDAECRYWGGFSEAQWTSVALGVGVVAAQYAGWLPCYSWQGLGVAGLLVTMGVMTLQRRRGGRITAWLGHPRHIREVVAALEAGHDRAEVVVHRTSPGLQLSTSQVLQADGVVTLVALSVAGDTLTEAQARRLATLIVQLKYRDCPHVLLQAETGVFQLLIYPVQRPAG